MTSIDIVLGLSRPTSGEVRVFGQSPVQAVAVGRIAAVMQSGGLLKDLTVVKTAAITASLFRSPRPVDEVLERAGIADLARRKVGKCSGGEQQRLRFAMALLPDPDLLILDGPTTGMDVEARRSFWSAIRDDARRGRTVLFATHYLDEADAFADRIVMIRHGAIVADGTSAEVKGMPAGRTVGATLPDAELTALSCLPGVTSVDIRGDSVLLQTTDSDAVLRHLLRETSARNLEVIAHNLEEAFMALTADRSENLPSLNRLGPETRTATLGSAR